MTGRLLISIATLGLLAGGCSQCASPPDVPVNGVLLIVFHRTLKRTLLVVFPELEWAVVIFFVNVPYWLGLVLGATS